MIRFRELHELGIEQLQPRRINEATVRRAISTLCYSLFHRLASAGAASFTPGGAALVAQASRAYDHSSIRKACEVFTRSRRQPLPTPLSGVLPDGPDPRVLNVADAFIQLQTARHSADSDMVATFSRLDGLEVVEIASAAHDELDALAGLPDLVVFLTALLLADRWKRGG